MMWQDFFQILMTYSTNDSCLPGFVWVFCDRILMISTLACLIDVWWLSFDSIEGIKDDTWFEQIYIHHPILLPHFFSFYNAQYTSVSSLIYSNVKLKHWRIWWIHFCFIVLIFVFVFAELVTTLQCMHRLYHLYLLHIALWYLGTSRHVLPTVHDPHPYPDWGWDYPPQFFSPSL